MYETFIAKLADAGKQFVADAKNKSVAIIAHFDTDGLCAASIMEQALARENISFTTTCVQHIDDASLSLVDQDADIILCVDIGATKISKLATFFPKKTILVLDHHQVLQEETTVTDVLHLNPYLDGIDERNSISGAGVTYFFALGMNAKNREFAHLGVLGALGDTQEKRGFTELNNKILQHAIIQKTIKVGKRIKLFGLFSRPLVKVLEYSSDISIPGVTGSEDGAKRLLDDLRIQYEWRGRLKKWHNLRPWDQEKLTQKILELKRDTPEEELVVPTYSLTHPDYRKELADMKEFATIINACGRLEEYRVALDALRADALGQEQALMQLRVYKSAIYEGLQLVEQMRTNNELIQSDSYVIINFKESLRPSLAGIIASILSRNRIYKEGIVVCTLARDTELTKISLRLNKESSGLQLQVMLESIVQELDADAGGHDHAAGAVIKTADEEKFIALLEDSLKANV